MSFEPGQRVRCPGGMSGDIVKVANESAVVYMGVYDGKRVEKTFPLDRVRPTLEQELEDLI